MKQQEKLADQEADAAVIEPVIPSQLVRTRQNQVEALPAWLDESQQAGAIHSSDIALTGWYLSLTDRLPGRARATLQARSIDRATV